MGEGLGVRLLISKTMKILSLKLTNFRQYENFEIDFDDKLTVIAGNNTKGKSSILEAIALLIDGNSPFTSDLDDIISYNAEFGTLNRYFRIQANINDNEKEFEFVFYYEKLKKQLLIDKKKVSKKTFHRYCATIFSPEEIEILMISASKRREFLNNFIAKIDLDYRGNLVLFEKIHRQRNAYLKKLSKNFYDTGNFNINDQQINYWTNEYAKASAKLMSKRSEIINKLCQIDETIKINYKPSLTLNLFEDLANIEDLTRIHFDELMSKLKRDIALGYTHIGAHRDDWSISTDKDIKRYGSRGEKRVAIGNLLFLIQDILQKELGYYPILLLDDISSELDDLNISKVMSQEYLSKQQTIITTIRENDLLNNFKLEEYKLVKL